VRYLFENKPAGYYETLYDRVVFVKFSVKFLNENPSPLNKYNCDVEYGDPIDVTVEGYPNVVVKSVWFKNVPDAFDIEEKIRNTLKDEEFTRCHLQKIFHDAFTPFFGDEPIEVPGLEDLPYSLSYLDILAATGNMLISPTDVYFPVPCVPTTSSAPIGGSSCTNVVINTECMGEWDSSEIILPAGLYSTPPGKWMDFPKMFNQTFIDADSASELGETIQKYALTIVCNHGNDCTTSGDIDGDGFCDEEDFCPYQFTGSNCDHDEDGYGESAFGKVCPVLDLVEEFAESVNFLSLPWVSEEEKSQLVAQLCGACDNCPDAYNPEIGESFPGEDPDTLTQQWDWDQDGLGDVCDPDADDDGVRNEYDCNWLNDMVAMDRDRDFVCDEYIALEPYGEPGCTLNCQQNASYYGEDYDLEHCLEKCVLDNCIKQYNEVNPVVYNLLCAPVDRCVGVEDTLDATACPGDPDHHPYCTYVEVADDYNKCRPFTDECAKAFANPDQRDTDGDGIGDQCEEDPLVAELNFKPALYMQADWYLGGTWNIYGTERFMVDFRTVGGSLGVDEANTPPTLTTTATDRDGVNVGACYCVYHDDEGNWDPRCAAPQTGRCRRDRTQLPGYQIFVWSPLNSPQIAETVTENGNTVPKYPYHLASEFETAIADYDLIYDRKFTFKRGLEAENFHAFGWPWLDSVDYKKPSLLVDFQWVNNADDYDAELHPQRTTAVRITWPRFGIPEQLSEVAISNNEPIRASQELSGVGPYLVSPQELIITVIPSSVNHFDDPRGPLLPAYLLGNDPLTGVTHLFGVSAGTPQVSRVWSAQTAAPFNPAAPTTATAGRVEPDLVGLGYGTTAVMIYQEAMGEIVSSGDAAPQPSPARMYLGVLDEGELVTMMTAGELFGTVTPEIMDAQAVYVPGMRQVLVFGTRISGSGGGEVTHPDLTAMAEVWRFSLLDGSWQGPRPLARLPAWGGFTARYEKASGKVIVFGGTSAAVGAAGVASAKVYAVDPLTLAVWELSAGGPVPPEVARSRAGMFLDRSQRRLYVYGGQRQDGWLSDGWVFDLKGRSWTRVTAPGASGPVLTSPRPLLLYDATRKSLWTGDMVGARPAEGLSLQGYDRKTSNWVEMEAIQIPEYVTWPVADTYLAGRSHVYPWKTPAETAWPGQTLLASLQAELPLLDLKVGFWTGARLGQAETEGPVRQAAFVCPPAETCALSVQPLRGAGYPGGVSFELDVQVADPVLESYVSLGGRLTDLAFGQDRLHVAGMRGLWVLAGEAALSGQAWVHGPGYTGLTGVEMQGRRLFVSRLGLFGLVALDVTDAEEPVELGRTPTLGLGWDVAVDGDTVYVAHGIFGIGAYDASDPQAMSWAGQLWPGGRIMTVAVCRYHGLLAAGRPNGKVYLYALGSGDDPPQRIDTLEAAGRLKKVVFREGRLWVLHKRGKTAEIFEEGSDGLWRKAGGIGTQARRYFFGRTHGARAYTIGKKAVEVYRFEPGS
jgi:hypothetical protein